MSTLQELNSGLSFQALTEEQRGSFLPSPAPVLVRFEQGDCVYKWTGYDFVRISRTTGKEQISEYWCPWNELSIGALRVPGFKELRTRYRNVGGSVGRPQEFARARNAVTHQWNEMTSILKARFRKPVWGFVGRTAPQRFYQDRDKPEVLANVTWIGGDFQLCIPNLTPEWIEKL